MRIGIIGTGNMGSMLADAFSANGRHQIRIFNRTIEKANALASEISVEVAANPVEIAKTCDVVFVCTKPADGKDLVENIGGYLNRNQVLATTISSVPAHDWEGMTPAAVAKVIPSIVQRCRRGIVLVSYGERFHSAQHEAFERLLGEIATPFTVREKQLRVCSDLTSCSPAFISLLLLQWSRAAEETGQISASEAEHLLGKTLSGVAAMLDSGYTLSDILSRVSIPGGVTEAGVQEMQDPAFDLFRRVHYATRNHSHPVAERRTPVLSEVNYGED